MASFAYRAVHASGRIQKGHMTAANENELAFYLRQIDLELIEAKKARRETPRRNGLKLKGGDLIGFCGQMEDLLRAGSPFDEALALVIETLEPGSALAARLAAVAQAIRAGSSVSGAFAASALPYDPVFLALLEAGEQSGDLAATFARLTRQLRRQAQIKRELTRALRYPLFLLAVAFAVTSFMMGFVVPEIVSFLTSLGGELPLATRILLRLAGLFETLWWLAPALALLGWLAVKAGRRLSPAFAERADGWKLALPSWGPVLRKLALARFAASLNILLKSGLSLPDSVRIAGATLGNLFLSARAREAADRLIEGRAFSQASASLFPPPVLQMIKVGEKSGAVPKALEEIARSYDRETQESVAAFLGALEPALTGLIGALLAWIVLAVLGPVYGSLGPLAGGL